MNYFDNNPREYSKNNNNSYENIYQKDSEGIVSVGAWIGILLVTAIPFANIIGLLIMAFGVENKNIRNYARASLIIVVIGVTFAILLSSCS